MLDLGPDHGDDAVDPVVEGIKLAPHGRLAHHPQTLPGPLNAGRTRGADMAHVGPDRDLVTIGQVVPDLAVVDLRRRGIEAGPDKIRDDAARLLIGVGRNLTFAARAAMDPRWTEQYQSMNRTTVSSTSRRTSVLAALSGLTQGSRPPSRTGTC